ncbi:MAG: DUF2993 domain-containing protein [Chloroflexaceae bacterium]|nr:DUF2993 domain-containing protein [Chloroflexaceae bacterium]
MAAIAVGGVETLEVAIGGRNRQILGGYIPEVTLTSRGAVYQGLHFASVSLQGENIRINLAEVLRGEPLRLLEGVRVAVEAALGERDLVASLESPLVGPGVRGAVGATSGGGQQPGRGLLEGGTNSLAAGGPSGGAVSVARAVSGRAAALEYGAGGARLGVGVAGPGSGLGPSGSVLLARICDRLGQ